jgi:hypothetical protein
MDQYVGLDVSLEQTSICVVDSKGKPLWQGKCASTPEALAAVIRTKAPETVRIGLESGPSEVNVTMPAPAMRAGMPEAAGLAISPESAKDMCATMT